MTWTTRCWAALLALALAAAPVCGAPAIVHDPIKVAVKGQPLGVRATVRDATARVEGVSLFYAASRGMTPFRVPLTSSGAGTWYGTIPGHMIGPGTQLFYYVQAENADGESRETEWQTVKVVESGVAPEAIPAASTVAQQAQQQMAGPAAAQPPAAPPKSGKSKYLLPAAIIVGGAAAVGGALAIASYNSGSSSGEEPNPAVAGNYGGSYDICFHAAATTNNPTPAPVCDAGLVNIYVTNGTAQIVGLWGAEVLSGPVNGNVFTIVKETSATAKFPSAHLIAAGEFAGHSATVRIDGYSTDPLLSGNFGGRLQTTKR